MSKIIEIKGVRIGEGTPKIIVPIVGGTKDEILLMATSLTDLKIDLVEWRADFFEEVFDTEAVLLTLQALRQILKDIPILFTFRTKNEGGEKEISMRDYTSINKAVAESGWADLVDVEVFSGDPIVRENIDNIHRAGALVIGSNHDFSKTPIKAELVSRLRKMQKMGADIPKIAVMPNNMSDVLTLLDATREMYEMYADRPIITMSMSSKGVISRVAGESFGSAMTFGSVGKASAPGQISADQLRMTLNVLHQAI